MTLAEPQLTLGDPIASTDAFTPGAGPSGAGSLPQQRPHAAGQQAPAEQNVELHPVRNEDSFARGLPSQRATEDADGTTQRTPTGRPPTPPFCTMPRI